MASSASPSSASASYSPARRKRGRRSRRRVPGRGRGRPPGAKLFSASSEDDGDMYSILATSGDDDDDVSSTDSFFARAFAVSKGRRPDFSPERPSYYAPPRATTKSLGNLGGAFARPGSSYRTYRAKHARLLRAQSSERAAARTRKLKFRESIDKQRLPRSRSADSARQRREHQHGTSGMTSPLLRREGFGLLQSSAIGKVIHAVVFHSSSVLTSFLDANASERIGVPRSSCFVESVPSRQLPDPIYL